MKENSGNNGKRLTKRDFTDSFLDLINGNITSDDMSQAIELFSDDIVESYNLFEKKSTDKQLWRQATQAELEMSYRMRSEIELEIQSALLERRLNMETPSLIDRVTSSITLKNIIRSIADLNFVNLYEPTRHTRSK